MPCTWILRQAGTGIEGIERFEGWQGWIESRMEGVAWCTSVGWAGMALHLSLSPSLPPPSPLWQTPPPRVVLGRRRRLSLQSQYGLYAG